MRVKPDVETAQVAFELEGLLAIFDDLNPARVLEIGVWHGGTLWHWLQEPGRTVVAVDDTMYEADDWNLWAYVAGASLHLVQGNSHDPAISESVAELGPYDFIHIDAGHDYGSVRADWDIYSPLLAAGGVVAFHDIAAREGYGVSELWAELKKGNRTMEIWAGREAYCGIGVLWAK